MTGTIEVVDRRRLIAFSFEDMRFVFRLGYRERRTTLALRGGFVTDELIGLARTEERRADQERRLDALKLEMAERVMARPADEVYDASDP